MSHIPHGQRGSEQGLRAGQSTSGAVESAGLLLRVAEAILEAPAVDASLTRRVFEQIAPALGVDVFCSFRAHRGRLWLVDKAGVPDEMDGAFASLALGEALCGRVAESGAALSLDEALLEHDEGAELFRRMRVRAYACQPLLARDGSVLGTFAVASRGRGSFGDRDLELLGSVSRLLAGAWERQRREARAHEESTRFRLALEAADLASWETDLTTGENTWDDRMVGLLGVPPEQARTAALSWASFIHPDDRERALSAFRAASVEGGPPYEVEFRVRRHDGSLRWFSSRGLVVGRSDGRRMVGLVQDITDRIESEAALRESRERLQAAVSASGSGTFRWNIRTDQLEWDEELDRLFGLPPGKTIRTLDRFVEAVHPDDRQGVIDRCRRCAAEGADFDMELRVVRPDGELRWLYDRGKTFFDEQGRPSYMTGTCIDVTDRKLADERLQKSEALLSAVLDALPVGVLLADASGAIFRDNAAIRALWGGTPETNSWQAYGEWVGYWPETGRRIEAHEWGLARALLRGEVVAGELVECERFDTGERRLILNNAAPVRDASGQIVAGVVIAVDVTEQVQSERALRQRTRELQSLADNSPDIISRIDRQMRHVFVNRAVEKATGLPSSAFVGKTNRELGMPTELCDQWEEALRSVFETGQPTTVEYCFDSPGGPRWYASRLVAERDGDHIEQVLGIARDVTDQKRYEQALREADRRKDEFLATLAHELRNPLAPIRTGVQLLRERGAPDPLAARVQDTIDRQVAHMVRLVDDLLDVARIRTGKITLARERVSLPSVIEQALETSRPSVEAGRHRLELALPGEPLWVDGDGTRLAQIVGNLVTNAAKYTPDGGHIEVRCEASGDEVVLSVRDDGLGIEADRLPRIFEMFTQVDHTLARSQGGLGIGLSLVRRLVEMHHGSIEARSDGPGRGSDFVVRLPRAEPPASAPAPAAPRREAKAGLRVLLVDDNVDGADMLDHMLRLHGHVTRVCHDGQGALEAAGDFRPDVVLLDIGLPDIDGHELARRLRAQPATGGALLVALTGWGSEDDRARSRAAGFDQHLTKPVDMTALEAVLSSRASAG